MTIIFHAERRASLTEDVPLARYEPDRNLWGTRIWAINFELPSGEYLLSTGGTTFIKHAKVSIPGYGTNYAIYANCRVALFSASSSSLLPENGTPPPEVNVIGVMGSNIIDATHHYALIPTVTQKEIGGGAHRIEMWAAAGTDASDVDGLGALGCYNAGNCHQFNVKVETL